MAKKMFLYLILALALAFGVSAVGNVNIVEGSVSIIDNPGAINGTQHITVNNTGTFTLSNIAMNSTTLTSGVNTIPGTAVTFVLNPVSLNAGESAAVAVIATIPSTQRAGTYTGTITASHNSSHQDTASLTVSVNEAHSCAATATSPTIAKGMSGEIAVNVTNTGNADIPDLGYTVSSVFTSTAGNITYSSLTPHPFPISYGSSNTVRIGFSPPASQASGVYSGQIAMSYSGCNLTLPLTFTVRDPVYSISMPDIIYPSSGRNVNVTQTATVTNNGDYALTGITLNTTAPNTWVTTPVPGSLAAGASFTVTLISTVPEDADSGTRQIGTLAFTSSHLNSSSAIKTNAVSKLAFDSVKVSLEDGSWKSVNNGSTFGDDAKPGDTFAVKVKLENLFTDDEDIDMDADVTALFKGAGEDGEDIDGDSDSVDIDAGEKSSEIEIDFDEDTIDWEASAGKLVMELTAVGNDDNGATHTATYNFSIELKRETDSEILFTRFDGPSTARCGSSFTLYAEGRSVGEDSEDEAVLKIINDNLGINVEEKFPIGTYDDDDDCNSMDDEDESDCREFEYSRTIQVPAGMAPGTYTIEGKLYTRDGDEQTDEETIEVDVECSSSASTAEEEETQTTSTTGTTTTTTQRPATPAATTTPPAQGATTSSVEVMYGGGRTSAARGIAATMPTRITDTTREKGFTDSNGYVALLSVLSVLLIIGIIVLLVYAFSRPRK
jgi:uncharacterized membrane protein